MLPDRIEVMGRWYRAEDTLALSDTPAGTEQWMPIRALCLEYGVDPHKAYDAIRDGALKVRIPNGQTRGRRCRRSDFVEWLEERWMVPC